jgi:hypothetical protein
MPPRLKHGPNTSGRANPQTPARLLVRLEVHDEAGNVGVSETPAGGVIGQSPAETPVGEQAAPSAQIGGVEAAWSSRTASIGRLPATLARELYAVGGDRQLSGFARAQSSSLPFVSAHGRRA